MTQELSDLQRKNEQLQRALEAALRRCDYYLGIIAALRKPSAPYTYAYSGASATPSLIIGYTNATAKSHVHPEADDGCQGI